MNEIPKRSKLWHISRWLLIGIAVVATIGASVLTEENWRARRAWEKYKRDAEARGERLEWAAYTQTNAPDEQNFFKAPIFSALTAAQWDERAQDWKPEDTNTVDRSKMSPWRSDGSSPDGAGGDWAQGRLTDLKAWQDYYRSPATNAVGQFPVAAQPRTPAVDVLLALSKYDSAIEELRQAARRPYAQLDLYDIHNNQKATLMLRYDATLKSCAQVLQLRAIAELADGQDAKALDDVKLLLRLENILRQQPTYMEHLVSLAITALALRPVYEGLVQHRWNDTQLAEMEGTLAEMDFLADYQSAVRSERAFVIGEFETRRVTREIKTVIPDEGSNYVITVSLRFLPGFYFYRNELTYARLCDKYALPLVAATNRLVFPAAERVGEEAARDYSSHDLIYQPIEALLAFSSIPKSVMKFALAQSRVDLARMHCALERYRLAHGNYPDTLDALVPQFIEKLPHDVIGGKPLHYRLNGDGKFILYSVGWNEKDDGGMVAKTKEGRSDITQGDWVWRN